MVAYSSESVGETSTSSSIDVVKLFFTVRRGIILGFDLLLEGSGIGGGEEDLALTNGIEDLPAPPERLALNFSAKPKRHERLIDE